MLKYLFYILILLPFNGVCQKDTAIFIELNIIISSNNQTVKNQKIYLYQDDSLIFSSNIVYDTIYKFEKRKDGSSWILKYHIYYVDILDINECRPSSLSLGNRDSFSTFHITKYTRIIREIRTISHCGGIYLENVFFEFHDESTIFNYSDSLLLCELKNSIINNPSTVIKIIIEYHTNHVHKYSKKRADLITAYLVNNGISKLRLIKYFCK